jgi:hypothetical protein
LEADQQAVKQAVLAAMAAAAALLAVVAVRAVIVTVGVVAAVLPDIPAAAAISAKDLMHMVLHRAEVNILQPTEQAQAAVLDY